MARSTSSTTPRLPKSWPKRVRSAVLHAISLARYSVTHALAHAATSRSERVRLLTEVERLEQQVGLLIEELRIKDARMARIPAARRPQYPPIERLAILELRASRGWTAAAAAERMQVTPATIASWMQRLNEEGPAALVQTRQPVNKYPEFVAYIVRRLKVLCPSMGKARIAQVLCRAGLHLGTTTVGRMLNERPNSPAARKPRPGRRVRSRHANHIWNVDLTTVPTSTGFWISWMPWSLPQRWPFCWWIAVAVDHYSRRVVGWEVYEQQPSSKAVRQMLDRAIRDASGSPKHLITDQGKQFTAKTFRRWCRQRDIAQRFGAVEKYGSLAVVERFMRTLKGEATRRFLVPLDQRRFAREIDLFIRWYNGHRPHSGLDTSTPDEAFFGRRPATTRRRFEPRRRWPHDAPCAGPRVSVRGRCGTRIELDVRFASGRRHLPVVRLTRAA